MNLNVIAQNNTTTKHLNQNKMKKLHKIEHDLDYEPKQTNPWYLLKVLIIACIISALIGIGLAMFFTI